MEPREILIETLKKKEVLKTPDVLKAFEKVSRENFVAKEYKSHTYVDEALPLFSGQTISQPSTVAVMTEALELSRSQRVLEIGTGSGYQSAIISEIIGDRGILFSVERLKKLHDFAKENLERYENIRLVLGDGSKGLPDNKPFDRIIVTAGVKDVPKPLLDQLRVGGIMVVPMQDCRLLVITKKDNNLDVKNLGNFKFIPLVE
jgi:protein-L-isoaspartate(D-aspartate) O-methyltransferase